MLKSQTGKAEKVEQAFNDDVGAELVAIENFSEKIAVDTEFYLMLSESLRSLEIINQQITVSIEEINKETINFENSKYRAQNNVVQTKESIDKILYEIKELSVKKGTIQGELNTLVIELDRVIDSSEESEHIKNLKSTIHILKKRQAKHQELEYLLGKLTVPGVAALESLSISMRFSAQRLIMLRCT